MYSLLVWLVVDWIELLSVETRPLLSIARSVAIHALLHDGGAGRSSVWFRQTRGPRSRASREQVALRWPFSVSAWAVMAIYRNYRLVLREKLGSGSAYTH